MNDCASYIANTTIAGRSYASKFCLSVAAVEHPALRPRGAYERGSKRGRREETIEAEFVASDVFRAGSLVAPLVRRLWFEGHYFGGDHTDAGFTGASWALRYKSLLVVPGFGVVFGSNQFRTSPSVTFRWDYRRRWFVTQGLLLPGILKTPIVEEANEHENGQESGHEEPLVRPTIADGNHVSVRLGRFTIGGTWEHIHFREGDEWKGGGRLQFRLFPRLSAVLYVLGPNSEVVFWFMAPNRS